MGEPQRRLDAVTSDNCDKRQGSGRSQRAKDWQLSTVECAAAYTGYHTKALILGPEIILVRGLVKFVPAVAYHFCLNLLATFSQPRKSIISGPSMFPRSEVMSNLAHSGVLGFTQPSLPFCLHVCILNLKTVIFQHSRDARLEEKYSTAAFLAKVLAKPCKSFASEFPWQEKKRQLKNVQGGAKKKLLS